MSPCLEVKLPGNNNFCKIMVSLLSSLLHSLETFVFNFRRTKTLILKNRIQFSKKNKIYCYTFTVLAKQTVQDFLDFFYMYNLLIVL